MKQYRIRKYMNKFQYIVIRPIENLYYSIKQGVKNLYRFFPVIWKFRGWDYGYVLDVWKKTLEELREGLTWEEYEMREKRKKAITSLIKEFQNLQDYENYVLEKIEERYPHLLTYSEERSKVYAEEIEKERNRIFKRINYLLKGQNLKRPFPGNEETEEEKEFKRKFDGSGIEGWWD